MRYLLLFQKSSLHKCANDLVLIAEYLWRIASRIFDQNKLLVFLFRSFKPWHFYNEIISGVSVKFIFQEHQLFW